MFKQPFREKAKVLTAASMAVLTGAALLASPAEATTSSAPPGGSEYVALGSSYAAGGRGLMPGDPSDPEGVCGRSINNYPHQVAFALGLELTDATCSGAETQNITSSSQRIVSATGVHLVDPQLNAVDSQTELVTITIGGNDVRYVGSLMASSCQADLAVNPDSPLGNGLRQYGMCTPVSTDAVLNAIGGLEDNLVATIEAVQTKAPRARVLLVDYLTVLPQNGQPCAGMPIPKKEQKFLLNVADAITKASKHAARRAGAELVAVSKDSIHHDVCSSDPWVTGYDLSRADNLMHPNAEGHAAMRNAVLHQLAEPRPAR